VVSPDAEFAPVGDHTKIKYRDDFNAYKKILIQGKNSKPICALFNWYNTAPLDNHGENAQPHDDDANKIQDALDHLDGSDDDEEPVSGDHSGSE
jgi:hypothetical protein